jgi:hypothetical protein
MCVRGPLCLKSTRLHQHTCSFRFSYRQSHQCHMRASLSALKTTKSVLNVFGLIALSTKLSELDSCALLFFFQKVACKKGDMFSSASFPKRSYQSVYMLSSCSLGNGTPSKNVITSLHQKSYARIAMLCSPSPSPELRQGPYMALILVSYSNWFTSMHSRSFSSSSKMSPVDSDLFDLPSSL